MILTEDRPVSENDTPSAWRVRCRISVVFGLGLTGTMLLAGCVAPTPPPAKETPLVDQLIAKSSDRIASAWEMMARTEAAASPVSLAPPIDMAGVPLALQAPVTWNWSGPADQAVSAIAARVGYRFASTGARAAEPVIVTVSAKDTPAVMVLRDIGLQAGARARIETDPNPPGAITYVTTSSR